MRKLRVVPIIHTSADLGTLAPAIDNKSRERLGEDLWVRHKRTVDGFWHSVAIFFSMLMVAGFKVYQDGLIANGEMGMRIVTQGVCDGSKNYEIIAELLENGAELVRTEDLTLVKREYDLLSKVVKANSMAERASAAAEFKSTAKDLLSQRDSFIAQRIDQTLADGETGSLFIGAYHDVITRLPGDIIIKEVKETAKVREYHAMLTDLGRDDRRFQQLSEYLVAPPLLD